MNDRRKRPSPEANMHNLAAEKIILGKILQNESVFWELNGSVQHFHFFKPIHQEIFTTLHGILHEGKRANLSTIISRIGPEYDGGASTMTLITALIRDAEEIEDINKEVRVVIEAWQRRRIMEIFDYGMKEAKKADVDTGYLLSDMEHAIKDVSVNSQAEPLRNLGQLVTAAVNSSAKAFRTQKSPGIDTGLPSLDEILGRIHGGDFGVIGARQGDAKTVLGLQLARRADALGRPAALFELEMRGEDLGRRVLAGDSNVSVSEIEEGSYEMFALEELRAVQEALKDSKVYVDDRPKLRIDQIKDRCIAMKRSKGLSLIVVDHLRLVGASGRYKDKFERIEYITGEMKSIAKELDIAVIALSQVTRASQRRDDPAPQLNDLDGGSSIEQDADWVLGMFRRDRWLKTQMPHEAEGNDRKEWAEKMQAAKGKIEIRCLKRRRGEDGEMRQFEFVGRRGLIQEL